jgi:hypothetical protein
VSYRGAAFKRGKARNIDEVRRLVAAGRARIVFESTVTRVGDGWAELATPALAQRVERVRADAVLALLGGAPSRGLLDAAGVRLEGA